MVLPRTVMPEIVTIVGGGLAGLTLGIGLRQRGVPVALWEAGRYPRHRVCGEFISGNGPAVLARLGLLNGLKNAGSGEATNVAFFNGSALAAKYQLPQVAWCVSRFVLDAWLAREFENRGGELRVGTRWKGEFIPGVVRAGGRRSQPMVAGWRFFGLKIHARGVALEADLEMHFVPAGYVGLCRLPGGEVNICGLFRAATTVPDLAKRWRDWLGGPPGTALHGRLAGAQTVENTFCSVAGLGPNSRFEAPRTECCVGDALAMIPPVAGNGMSMAFESAELAIEPLVNFSFGRVSWAQARHDIAQQCNQRFRSRLRWASWIQWALFHSPLRSSLFLLAPRAEWLWRGMFSFTR